MTDAMQTIRDLLVEISDWTVQPYAGARPECHFCGGVDGAHNDDCISLRAQSSLSELDSQAGATSEDAKKEALQFAEAIYKAVDYDDVDDFSGRVINIYDDCVAIIQARDERIRRETIAVVLLKIGEARHEEVLSAEADWAYDKACKDIAALLKTEATNGQ